MRATNVVLLLTLGCQGDPVLPTPVLTDTALTGDAADSASSSDASGDATAIDGADGAPADAPSFDAAFPGACTASSANLVTNGTFESGVAGWNTTLAKITPIGGAPCGAGVRVHETGDYGGIYRREARPIKAGSKLRLRAWWRGNGVLGGTPPRIGVRLLRPTDAGPDSLSDEITVIATLAPEWSFGEATLVTKADTTHFDVLVTSLRTDKVPDDYLVAGIGLVVE